MKLEEIKEGDELYTRIGGESTLVRVLRFQERESFRTGRKLTRVVVQRVDNGRILPKARAPSALHRTPRPLYSGELGGAPREPRKPKGVPLPPGEAPESGKVWLTGPKGPYQATVLAGRPPWVVVEYSKGAYSVTHTPTGLAIVKSGSKTRLAAIVRELLKNPGYSEAAANVDHPLHQEIKAKAIEWTREGKKSLERSISRAVKAELAQARYARPQYAYMHGKPPESPLAQARKEAEEREVARELGSLVEGYANTARAMGGSDAHAGQSEKNDREIWEAIWHSASVKERADMQRIYRHDVMERLHNEYRGMYQRTKSETLPKAPTVTTSESVAKFRAASHARLTGPKQKKEKCGPGVAGCVLVREHWRSEKEQC
jgi:hypothetical protein